MYHERIQIETATAKAPRFLVAIAEGLRKELAYHQLVHELSHLSPDLLADIDLKRGDIRRFARAAVSGKPMNAVGADEGPVTTIGSADWSRAYLLRMGSN